MNTWWVGCGSQAFQSVSLAPLQIAGDMCNVSSVVDGEATVFHCVLRAPLSDAEKTSNRNLHCFEFLECRKVRLPNMSMNARKCMLD